MEPPQKLFDPSSYKAIAVPTKAPRYTLRPCKYALYAILAPRYTLRPCK